MHEFSIAKFELSNYEGFLPLYGLRIWTQISHGQWMMELKNITVGLHCKLCIVPNVLWWQKGRIFRADNCQKDGGGVVKNYFAKTWACRGSNFWDFHTVKC